VAEDTGRAVTVVVSKKTGGFASGSPASEGDAGGGASDWDRAKGGHERRSARERRKAARRILPS
jgi:hypothetical protein